jgi:hypothetical protein
MKHKNRIKKEEKEEIRRMWEAERVPDLIDKLAADMDGWKKKMFVIGMRVLLPAVLSAITAVITSLILLSLL